MLAPELALQRAKVGTGAQINFSGNWKNDLESIMRLEQTDKSLVGTYTSAVSDTGASTIGDLVGYVDGDLISFVVHWRDFQAITAWVGQATPDSSVNTIKTLWQMTKQVKEKDEWTSINAGSDVFQRI